jgi:DNA-binding response OmpR family regulator
MKILVMSNDKTLADAITDGLAGVHYEIHYAVDGEYGLEIASTIQFDLIVLDWILHKNNGLTILMKLRRQRIEVPVLMVTADDSVIGLVKSLDSGANDCVARPFKIYVLIARMKALIRRSKWDLCAEISHDHLDTIISQIDT